MALGRLKFLQYLELRSVNCTGKGVFQFLNLFSNEFKGNRTFIICIRGNDSQLTFYEEVKNLLLLIAQSPEFPCTRNFVVVLDSCTYYSGDSVNLEWSTVYWRELKKIMNRVKAVHPSLRQHVVVANHVGDAFSRIDEYGLLSVYTEPAVYNNWGNWGEAKESDGVTVVNICEPDENENESEQEDEETDNEVNDFFSLPKSIARADYCLDNDTDGDDCFGHVGFSGPIIPYKSD